MLLAVGAGNTLVKATRGNQQHGTRHVEPCCVVRRKDNTFWVYIIKNRLPFRALA
jgi:hypothetical protein